MSLRAILWAMDEAPVEDAQSLLVLLSLCERADETGRNAWPSVDWLATRARCSTRTVHRHLRALEAAGLIERGDQRLVGHLRSDRRPVVWDVPGVRGVTVSPRDAARGDIGSTDGVTPGAERGDTDGTQTVLSLTGETVQVNTSSVRDLLVESFDAFWTTYPRKVGKGAARTAWSKALRKADQPAILAAVARYAEHHAARRTEARYIANPATWLNQERWDDVLPDVTARESSEAADADRIALDRQGFQSHWAGGGGF